MPGRVPDLPAAAAASWAVAVAVYRSWAGGPDPAAAPGYWAVAAAAGVSALGGLAPCPLGLLAGPLVWAAAAHGLGLLAARGAFLFALLAAGSVVTRLVLLGVLSLL